jgi:oligoendopeptidase F
MFDTLPATAQAFMDWRWSQIEPYYQSLESRELTAESVAAWLADWTQLGEHIQEAYSRLYFATTLDTTDEAAVKRFHTFLAEVIEQAEPCEQRLREKLLASGLNPPGFEIALRNMRTDAALFRQENVPLFTQDAKLSNEYDRVVGTQTVQWEGSELTLMQIRTVYQNPDRATRERAWKLVAARRLADREALNNLWQQFMNLRATIAANAGYAGDFRAYRWQQFKRFDYTPADCETFQRAIEQVVVPAATRVYERQRQRLGVSSIRPWDLDRDDIYPPSRPPLHPFQTVEELEDKAEAIFHKVNPELGGYFTTMRREKLLDLDNRKGKAPGAYCSELAQSKQALIFMNAVGFQEDVQTLLHEAGHAFHAFEVARLPYIHQRAVTMEIAEVASMAMELLAAPYLTTEHGGFYTPKEAARARIEHLEQMLLFWPYMAIVDAFQHWVYTHHAEATDPLRCDAAWGELVDRFLPGIDWSGLEDARVTGWQRKPHIFGSPFYYVDYGLAQMGAVQVWRNAIRDQAEAVRLYREALSLGGTRPLPELFAAAGARFAFDAATLGELVTLMESTIEQLAAV